MVNLINMVVCVGYLKINMCLGRKASTTWIKMTTSIGVNEIVEEMKNVGQVVNLCTGYLRWISLKHV